MKSKYHERIILYRAPEFHQQSISFYCVDKEGQIKRSFCATPNTFDSIVETVLNIIKAVPKATYEVIVPSPRKAEVTKKQIGILEKIVEMHNQGTKLYSRRQELRALKKKMMEQILERHYAVMAERVRGRNKQNCF